MDADVIIVGAGAAGLMTARTLSAAGKKVVILEARNRIGGRIYPLPIEDFGYEAQGGGEFVHGDAPLSKALLQEAKATLLHPTEWWNVFDGESRLVEHISPNDPELEKKLRELTQDMTIAEFFDVYFPGPEHADLRDYIFLRTEGYDAADPSKASTFAIRDELLNEGGWAQLNIKEGYGTLLRLLRQQCEERGVQFLLNKEVIAIDFNNDPLIACADTTTYKAGKIVVTAPISVLQSINFTPPIPRQLEAAAQIGFGGVIKILMHFKTKWWATSEREADFERMFFMFSHETIPTWWTQYPEPHLTLTGWLAGPKADVLSTQTDKTIIEVALQSLSNIFKISITELQADLLTSRVINWPQDKFARGGYSYATPTSAGAIVELQKPVNNKLYFAGEALGEGDTGGTVEAALSSGLNVAKQILNP